MSAIHHVAHESGRDLKFVATDIVARAMRLFDRLGADQNAGKDSETSNPDRWTEITVIAFTLITGAYSLAVLVNTGLRLAQV